MRIRELLKGRFWDYFILVARFLLGWTFLGYGYSKLAGGQFGVDDVILNTPLQDISLFKLSWYLFDHQPFKSFIGVSQLVCGILLIVNRTALLGAFMFLPIVTTILVIDLTFMPPAMANAFAWRLSFYVILDFLILFHYKAKLKQIWIAVWDNVNTKFKWSIWMYLLLPVSAIILEVAGAIPRVLTQLVLNPSETINGLVRMPKYLWDVFLENFLQ